MLKKLRVVVVMLLVIFVSCVAFLGVFQKENGVWRNLVPDYQYGMDIKGTRELFYALSTKEEEKYVYVDEAGNIKGEVWKDGSAITQEDESTQESQAQETENEQPLYAKETRTIKTNPDDRLTKENFEQAKKTIQKRLKEQGLTENKIRIDDVTGNLVIENVNDEEEIEQIKQFVTSPGAIKLVDYQNGEVLMDQSNLKKASVVFSNQSSYATYLQLEFDKEGAEKLKEISNHYVEIKKETENETAEENPEEGTEENTENEETEKKYISIVFDNTTMMTTYFGEEMGAGILQIAVGQARTSYEDFVQDFNKAQRIANMINSGVLPVTYELETDHFVKAEYSANAQEMAQVLLGIAILVPALFFSIKFKKNGALAAILNLGYIAILLLVLRLTNVEITNHAILAGFTMIILNIAFLKMLLKQLQTQKIEQAYKGVSQKFYLALVPVIVVAFVFTFAKSYAMSSVGMVVFWAMVISGLYHLIFTRTVFKREE